MGIPKYSPSLPRSISIFMLLSIPVYYWGPIALIILFIFFVIESLNYKFHIELNNKIKENYQGLSQIVFLETILDNIPDMIFVKEAEELRFVRFNKAGEHLLGHKSEDLIGKNDYDLFPREQADFFTMNDRMVFKSKKMLELPHEPIMTSTKGNRILHTKKIPIYDEFGEPKYLIGISEDITLKKHAAEAEKSLQSRDEFISVASHELKTPISSLKLQAQMIKRKIEKGDETAYSKDKVTQFVNQTEHQLTKLTRLVEDMLDVSRIRTGNLTMQPETLNLFELIQDILDRMKEQFLNAPCGYPVFHSSSKNVIGYWDKMRIEQVIINILSNAIRYGGGHVDIKLSVKDTMAVITIKDEGQGIPEEKREKIFERFQKSYGEGHIEGLGLGLYISKQIVKGHKGTIRVESESGQGSTFIIELPLNKSSES